MTQRVLVLGASGFVGRRLVDYLATTDWAIPIGASRHGRSTGMGVRSLTLDATNESALAAALQDTDAVVNCISGSADAMISSARVLFAAAARLPSAPRIVHLSSMAVYGPVSGVVDESATAAGTDWYAQAKIATEQLSVGHSPVVILRPGVVYGPGGPQWTRRIAHWLYSRRIGDLGAAGDGYCNLLYIDDLINAITQALRAANLGGKTFNLAMAEPPTWNEYFVRFAQALGAVPVARIGHRKLRIETKVLAPPLKIMEILSAKLGIRALHLPEAMPPSFVRLCSQEIRLDVTAAEHSLQLSWTPLDEGLGRAALWCRETLHRPAA